MNRLLFDVVDIGRDMEMSLPVSLILIASVVTVVTVSGIVLLVILLKKKIFGIMLECLNTICGNRRKSF